MPLYDFECSTCGQAFEAFLKMSESTDELSCPYCGVKRPKKLVSIFRTNAWSSFLDGMEKRISPEKFR